MKEEFHGIVLSVRDYKDVDAIVKVFTLEYGKQMFFVNKLNSGTHHLKSVLQPGTQATFIGQINRNGLSFLSDYKDRQLLWQQFEDIFVQAYLAYFISMCDAVVDDRIIHKNVYHLLEDAIYLIKKGFNLQIIACLFDIKLLPFWGVDFPFNKCQLSNNTKGPFDLSLKYGGPISQVYWEKDSFRLHINPNAIYIMEKMKRVNIRQINQLNISDEIIINIRKALDTLYDELVGVHLKSKQYIEQLNEWYNI